jgi:hypothetical protein
MRAWIQCGGDLCRAKHCLVAAHDVAQTWLKHCLCCWYLPMARLASGPCVRPCCAQQQKAGCSSHCTALPTPCLLYTTGPGTGTCAGRWSAAAAAAVAAAAAAAAAAVLTQCLFKLVEAGMCHAAHVPQLRGRGTEALWSEWRAQQPALDRHSMPISRLSFAPCHGMLLVSNQGADSIAKRWQRGVDA